ncbi:Rossmann-like domain-containing protein [Slackia heliotrinireducens]|uniref:Rossmann-like domain-containing protein n=1 Tax=Slackia heliotrinireducens TaxID=84110 RepID=UPI003315969E
MGWELYDALIDGIPEGIAVKDFCKGVSWSYVEAECGLGIAKTVQDGARAQLYTGNYLNLDLKSLAALAKSWRFSEASLGVAAMNAWYTQPDKLAALGADVDGGESYAGRNQNPFDSMEERYAGKKIAVIGHFPGMATMDRVGHLTVLERNCRNDNDVPDSACEYILPDQDFVFLTGTTLTNKTMPRLLELSRSACTVVAGPSSLPAWPVVEAGADIVAGSVVTDAQAAKYAVRGGSKQQWRAGIKKFVWEPVRG